MRIHRIIHHLLRRFATPEERYWILQNAIAQANKSLFIIVNELQEQRREHSEESDIFLPLEFRDLTPDELNLLCKLAVNRINSWANDGRLDDHPRLLQILFAWLQWSDDENCREFVNKLISTDKGVVKFLSLILDKAIAQAMTEYVIDPAWETYMRDLELFIPAKKLEPRVKQIFEDDYFEKLGEREQLAVMIFLDMMHADTKKILPKTSV